MEPSIRRPLARPILGLLLFLALFLPAKLWRASSEASVWMDEVHSIVLTARPVPEIVHLLAGDAHVLPPELIPIFRHTLDGFIVHPVADLPCDLLEEGSAVVLDLNPWHVIDRGSDQIARQAIANGLLSHSIEHRDDLVPYRWSTQPTGRIRLRGTLPAGRHTLHLAGVRLPQPQETARLRVQLADAENSPLFDADLGPGPFHLRLRLDLDDLARPLTDPVLTVHHPTWSPAEAFGNTDPRRLGFQLLGAWVGAVL